MFIREIKTFDDVRTTLANDQAVTEMREGLLNGDVYIFRNFMDKEKIMKLRGLCFQRLVTAPCQIINP